jgi:hydrogenase-4 component F
VLFTPALGTRARGEPSTWMVLPVVAGVVVLFLLGLHPPGELTGLISRAVTPLGATR